jgi:hypothetical protein
MATDKSTPSAPSRQAFTALLKHVKPEDEREYCARPARSAGWHS